MYCLCPSFENVKQNKTTKYQWILFLSQLDSTGYLYHLPESCFPTIKSAYASQGRTRLFIFSFCSSSKGYWNVFEQEKEKQTFLNINRLICVEKLGLKWKGDMLLYLLFSRSLVLKLIIYKMDIIYPSLRWIIKMQDSDTASSHFRVSDPVGLRWSSRILFLASSQVMLVVLVQGPYFEKHCSRKKGTYGQPHHIST